MNIVAIPYIVLYLAINEITYEIGIYIAGHFRDLSRICVTDKSNQNNNKKFSKCTYV